MAHHPLSVHDLPRGGERLDLGKLAKVRLVLLAVAAGGGLLSALRFFQQPGEFAYSWLFAFAFVFTLGAGGLFWVLLHHATNSGWGIAVRRLMEQLANMLPWVGLIGLPLVFFPSVREALWDWMKAHSEAAAAVIPDDAQFGSVRDVLHHHPEHHNALLYHKYPFLNTHLFFGALPGWGLRFFLYFILLGFGAYWLRRYSLIQDATSEVKPTLSARRFACGWLPVFAVAVTFAAIDWFQGLDYTWFSTMWGVYMFAGAALSSMAVLVLTAALLQRAGYLKVANSEHFHIMGKLMFAFVVFWAYVTFSQFFLIWYANITEETRYFLLRNAEGWNTGAIFTYLFAHFVIPFLLLLPAWVKRDTVYLAPVAAWVLFAHALDLYFIVVPERAPTLTGGASHVTPGGWVWDAVALVTVCAIFAALFIRTLAKHSLYPCGDPRLHESLNLHN
jgi:hypothetical protein